jgi:CRP/FNR family transcriptional regulator, dissimilatory nitrate respiration regulator
MTSTVAEFKQMEITNSLRRCRLFGELRAVDVERIAELTVTKALVKGEYLFFEGAPVHGFYVVRRGVIKMSRGTLLGREQLIRLFGAGESFAEETLVSESGYPADACALEDSQVLQVQKAGFVALLRRHPELALCIFKSISRHIGSLVERLDDLTLKDTRTRLANWLLQHCPNPESHEPFRIELPVTKRVLAAELGTASETFSRTLAKFRKQKLLSVSGKTVTLLCPSKLTHFLREQLAA